MGQPLHLAIDQVTCDVGPGIKALALHGIQIGRLGVIHGTVNVGVEQGAIKADLAVNKVKLMGSLLHGIKIQSGGTSRNFTGDEATKRLHQGESLITVKIDLLLLVGCQRHQLGELAVVQNVDDIVGDSGQKTGVVAHVVGIVVAQVLETRVVGHLARWKKRLGIHVSGDHGEAIKGQCCLLGKIRNGLSDCEATLRWRFLSIKEARRSAERQREDEHIRFHDLLYVCCVYRRFSALTAAAPALTHFSCPKG